MQQLPTGAMLAVQLSKKEIQPLLGEKLSLAASNGPVNCVVSGLTEAIDQLQNILTKQGTDSRRLHTSHAFHSQMMDSILEPFTQKVSQVSLNSPKIPFISNLTGTWITPAEAIDSSYWAKHLRQTVRFNEGIAQLLQEPKRIFLEVGLGRTLSTLIRKQKVNDQVVLCSTRHLHDQQSDIDFILKTLGQLWLIGVKIDWSGFYATEERYRILLPTYPFERQRYWIDAPKKIYNTAAFVADTIEYEEIDEVHPPKLTYAGKSLKKDYVAPRNEMEQTVADIWEEVLGIKLVGIYDNFFDLGGDSVVSVQVAALVNQAGLQLTPKQLFEYPTVAELAAVAQTAPTIQAEQGLVTGQIPFTPIQHWFFEQNLPNPDYWNKCVLLEVEQAVNPVLLKQALQQLLRHHDALRLCFVREESGWQQINASSDVIVPFTCIDLSELAPDEQELAIKEASAELHTSLNLRTGLLLRVAFFDTGTRQPSRLLLIIHYLTIDDISWRILLNDLHKAYQQLRQGNAVQFLPKTTSFKQWAERLQEYAKSTNLQQELNVWLSLLRKPSPRLAVDNPQGVNIEVSSRTVSVSLSSQETQALLKEVPTAYRTETEEVLLTALMQTLLTWLGTRSLLVSIENQGRTYIDDLDLSRTVGSFTTIFPVMLTLNKVEDTGESLKAVKEQLRSIPNRGFSYGVLCYLCGKNEIAQQLQVFRPEVSFAYLGELAETLLEPSIYPQSLSVGEIPQEQPSWLKSVQELNTSVRSPQGTRPYLLEISSRVTAGQLQLNWKYSENMHQSSTVENLAQKFLERLRSLIIHCQSSETGNYTPSDFTAAKMSHKDLSSLLSKINKSNKK